MGSRRLHYENAFGRFLAESHLAHIAVNQLRRPVVGDLRLKNFDFLVRARNGTTYLVEVKGKLFPYRYGRRSIYWENWISEGDLGGLSAWERALGPQARGLIVFAYHVTDPWDEARFSETFRWRGRSYGFLAVSLGDYRRYGRVRSANWHARNIPRELFASIARPASEVLLDDSISWMPAFEKALI